MMRDMAVYLFYLYMVQWFWFANFCINLTAVNKNIFYNVNFKVWIKLQRKIVVKYKHFNMFKLECLCCKEYYTSNNIHIITIIYLHIDWEVFVLVKNFFVCLESNKLVSSACWCQLYLHMMRTAKFTLLQWMKQIRKARSSVQVCV